MGHGAEVAMLKGNNAETPRYPYAAAAWWDWVSQACRESQEKELCSRSRGASLHKRHHVLHVATYSVLEETNGPKLQDFWHCLPRQTARGPPARAHLAAMHGLSLHGSCESNWEVVGRATRLQMDRPQRIEKHHGEFKVCWGICQSQQFSLYTKSSICTPWRIA